MSIFNKIYAALAAAFALAVGALGIHMRAKSQGAKEARAEDAQAVQKQAQEARRAAKAAKESTDNKSDEQIKQTAKSKYVRGAGHEK